VKFIDFGMGCMCLCAGMSILIFSISYFIEVVNVYEALKRKKKEPAVK
jgi:hypothetical protein